MPLNEVELRKTEFREGIAVLMADGQRWHIRKPKIRIGFTEIAGESDVKRTISFGQAYDHYINTIYGGEDVDGYEKLKAEFAVLAALLRENYELTSEQLSELIAMDIGDEASEDRWNEIRNALTGIAPKLSPDT